MSYRVWRLGLGSQYYEGRSGKSTDADEKEVVDYCLKEGVFPFHVSSEYVPSDFPDIESYRGDDERSTWKRSLWTVYNLIRPGDRVVLAKTKNSEPTDVFVYAKGTVLTSANCKPDAGPFAYRVDVLWDEGSGVRRSAKGMTEANTFFADLTRPGSEAQLKACGEYDLYQKVLNMKKYKSLNLILCGPPGTGKTYSTRRIACEICLGDAAKKSSYAADFENLTASAEPLVEFVTFHPSYDYSDFIEGFKPNEVGNFVVTPGVLKRMARRATQNPTKNYVLIIDEINRGNISKIFGEAITLLEEDKRKGCKDGFPVSLRLPTSPKEVFILPENLYVVGTMNTADRSIAMLDVALRRRFDFDEIMPNPALLKDAKPSSKDRSPLSQEKLLKNLNKWVSSQLLSRDHQIGHAWLDMSDEPTVDKVAERFVGKIVPLLLEWFYEPEQRDLLFKELLKSKGMEKALAAGAGQTKLMAAVIDCLYAIAEAKSEQADAE
jgi:hypothetical protein